MEDGFAHTYNAQLLFDRTPQIRKSDLLDALRRRCGSVEPLDGNPDSDLLSFVYHDYPVTYADRTIAAQTLMSISPTGLDVAKAEPALEQSWDWPEARAVVMRSRATMLVTDLLSSGLPYKARLSLFQSVVSAVLELAPCSGIYWLPSQRFVESDAYVRSKQAETFDPLFPAINVRLFNITNKAEGETLMDTLGLAALGLPDLQCHFTTLNVNEIARVLYNSAYYLFDKGDVIGDGQTIQGITPGDRWRCQHEDALVKPERVVLDLDPGKPYAAGNRRQPG